jgi:hypothetical protein
MNKPGRLALVMSVLNAIPVPAAGPRTAEEDQQTAREDWTRFLMGRPGRSEGRKLSCQLEARLQANCHERPWRA